MPVMIPPKQSGIAGCRLKGISLNWDDIKERGCTDPLKQRRVVCKHFDYYGGTRARKCYPPNCCIKDAGKCKDMDLIETG
ncbi:MAG TPA: hypothetical protein DER33_10440 [Syntrophomonas sp.]|jgi:hypothetical protein|nr:hypothetical protein [Syntrophomonas sp.]